jgi:hypothetical protein
MKYIKTLGLLAVAAAALMAFAGTASATYLTSTGGATPSITATAGPTSLDGAFSTVTCQSSEVASAVGAHGAGVPASGKVTTLDFRECNFPVTVDPAKMGTLSVHGTTTTGNGTLTSSGAEVAIHTSVGTCVFTTSNTDIGTVTGSNITGGHAVLDITGKIPRTGGNFLCGSSGTWTGSYTITGPNALEVH